MNKKIKKKEKFKYYRGIRILSNSVYTRHWDDKYKAILMTPDIERYFVSVSQAKSYVDKHYNEIIEDQEKIDWNFRANLGFNMDDIPF